MNPVLSVTEVGGVRRSDVKRTPVHSHRDTEPDTYRRPDRKGTGHDLHREWGMGSGVGGGGWGSRRNPEKRKRFKSKNNSSLIGSGSRLATPFSSTSPSQHIGPNVRPRGTRSTPCESFNVLESRPFTSIVTNGGFSIKVLIGLYFIHDTFTNNSSDTNNLNFLLSLRKFVFREGIGRRDSPRDPVFFFFKRP